MGIGVSVHNQVNEKVEEVSGYDDEAVSDFIARAPQASLARGVHSHADTMFNTKQLRQLIEELKAFPPTDEKDAQLIAVLIRAAESAIRQRGYLWFKGD
ncbi:hypothetical protein ACWDSJ_26625 [Nocardia sp. NPDC003482]